jgi:hypothetical protein
MLELVDEFFVRSETLNVDFTEIPHQEPTRLLREPDDFHHEAVHPNISDPIVGQA